MDSKTLLVLVYYKTLLDWVYYKSSRSLTGLY